MAWLGIWFGIYNICGGVWSNGVGQNRETMKNMIRIVMKRGLTWLGLNFGRDGEGGRIALYMGKCSINI